MMSQLFFNNLFVIKKSHSFSEKVTNYQKITQKNKLK